MLRERVRQRLVVVVREPFVEVVGDVVRKRIWCGVFEVDDDESVMRRGGGRRRVVQDEKVAIF